MCEFILRYSLKEDWSVVDKYGRNLIHKAVINDDLGVIIGIGK